MIARTQTRTFSRLTYIHAAHILLLTALLLIPTIGLAEIRLGQGDRVKAVIAGLSSLDFEAAVGADGNVDFAWLGTYAATGRLLTDLEAEVQADTEGKIIKQYDRDGKLFIIQLEGPDVNLLHVAYNPIVVTGSVSNPGQFEFTSGMTVREAVALAGGESNRLLATDVTVDATQVLRWQGDYGAAALDHAEAVIKGWRIAAEIALDYDAAAPEDTATVVSDDVLERIIQVQRKIMTVNRETDTGEQAYFERARSQVLYRIEILGQQQAKLREALTADEEEETRILDLVQRGLAAGTRASDVRKSTVLSATRLLDLENDLAKSEQDVIKLDRQTAAYEEQRLRNLYDSQSATEQTIRTARLRMDIVSQYLALTGSELATTGIIVKFGLKAIIHRNEFDSKVEISADLDTALFPGDTVEIVFEEVAESALIQ
jgi:polysaccharide export outer membrane protein